MTTPERLRRRQLIEGTALLLLGVFTILISFYFRAEDIQQRECLADQFGELTAVLERRGQLIDRSSRVTTRVVLEVARAKDSDDVRAALDGFIAQQARLEQARKESPVPPFPRGACD